MNKEKLNIITLFSGIGMQERGIENSGCFDTNIKNISEIDKDSILSYSIIHKNLTLKMIEDYSDYPSNNKMIEELKNKNIGYDFLNNRCYNWSNLAVKNEFLLKKYWLADRISKNLGDISLIDELDDCDLLTFSFPCTDISVNGKTKGIKNKETRSGLIYEVIRLLLKKSFDRLPKYLLMENVFNLIKQFKKDFDNLNNIFSQIGYNNYYGAMNACDYGIPQNRVRVFAIYIRKDLDKHKFTFPLNTHNECDFNDFADKIVDKKYFINDDYVKEHFEIKNYGLKFSKVSIGYLSRQNFKIFNYNSQVSKNIIRTLLHADYKFPALYIDLNNKIRHLTPFEYFKLMGMRTVDCQKCLDNGVSENNLYSQCGNGLVTNCVSILMQHLYKAQYDENYICDDEKIFRIDELF